MNNFLFLKKQEKAFTTGQLQAIHESLQNLGYKHDFQGFYADLADYCEKYVADVRLTDKEASPHVSDYLLNLLESLTQTGLRSKIFALCNREKRLQTELKVPVLYVHRQDAVEAVLSAMPHLESLLQSIPREPELIPGFAPPVCDKDDVPAIPSCPGMGQISRIVFGTKTLPADVTEPAKLSIVITVGTFPYEVLLYCNTQGAAIIHTDSIYGEGTILTENNRLLNIRQYAETFNNHIRSGFTGQLSPVSYKFNERSQ